MSLYNDVLDLGVRKPYTVNMSGASAFGKIGRGMAHSYHLFVGNIRWTVSQSKSLYAVQLLHRWQPKAAIMAFMEFTCVTCIACRGGSVLCRVPDCSEVGISEFRLVNRSRELVNSQFELGPDRSSPTWVT